MDLLLSWGHNKEDLWQIKESTKYLKLTKYDGVKKVKITQREALEILGRKEFISGISRAAFHFTAMRTGKNQINVLFDCGAMFK